MKIGIAYDTPEMYDFAFSFAGEDRKIVEEIQEYGSFEFIRERTRT